MRGKATTRGMQRGAGTHANEREGASRGDCDTKGRVELCVGADDVVLKALHAAAGEGGGRPGGDVDTADALVAMVLRYISGARAHAERGASRRSGVCGGGHHTLDGGRVWGACARRVSTAVGGGGHDERGAGGPGTHSNERKRAARVDCDAMGPTELCVGADHVVLEVMYAAAGEGGGRPGSDFDTADAVVLAVLRYISGTRAHAERGASRWRGVCGGGHQTLEGGGAGLGRVSARRVRPAAGEGYDVRGVGGEARTPTSAKAPLGSIATPKRFLNCALVPTTSSLKPFTPLPARVVVAPVAISTRRMRLMPLSCDAYRAREHTLSEEQVGGAMCGGGHQTLEGGGAGLGRVCARRVHPAAGEGHGACGVQGVRHAQQREQTCRSGRF